MHSSNDTSLPFLRSGSILSGLLPEGENVTLNEAGSPYLSDGSLIIDGILEIMPNVTIYISAHSSLWVRKGDLRAKGTIEKPISFESLTERWGGLKIEQKIQTAAGFNLLLAYNGLLSYSVGKYEFNRLFQYSHFKTLIRYCPACQPPSHQIIFYKRLGNQTNFDVYHSVTCNFTSIDNVLNTDFGR